MTLHAFNVVYIVLLVILHTQLPMHSSHYLISLRCSYKANAVSTMIDVPCSEYNVEDMGSLDLFLFSRSFVCQCDCSALRDAVTFQRRHIGLAAFL